MQKFATLVAAVGALASVIDEAMPEMRERLAEPTIQKFTASLTDLTTVLVEVNNSIEADPASVLELPAEVRQLVDLFVQSMAAQDATRNALLERQAVAFETFPERLVLALGQAYNAKAAPAEPSPAPSPSSEPSSSEPSTPAN